MWKATLAEEIVKNDNISKPCNIC